MEICIFDTPVKHADAAFVHIQIHIQVIACPACYLLRIHEMKCRSCDLCCLNIDRRERGTRAPGVQTDRKAGDWRGDHINKVEIIYF